MSKWDYCQFDKGDRVELSESGKNSYGKTVSNPHGVKGTLCEIDSNYEWGLNVGWDNDQYNYYRESDLKLAEEDKMVSRYSGLQHDFVVVDDPLSEDLFEVNLDVMEQTTTDPETGIPNYEKQRVAQKDSDKAMRFNEGKSQLSYMLDADVAMKGMCDVFAFGAEKYDRGNWKKGLDEKEIMDSMLRHLTAYNNGEVLDPESGLPHVDHITCNAIFLATFGKREK